MTQLEKLNHEILACTRCQLRAGATAPVCGFGNIGAKYMLIGEAPGKNEDELGMPFVGLSGKRLNQLLELAHIELAECYLTNVCRCRPERNRNPRRAEMKACTVFLWREIKIVKPKTIITLGSTPLSLFSPNGVNQMHGTRFEWEFPDEV
uniref:Type-4 uracil-DNA glycosylase n=1 Tax=viral metagenome TaxID=1070528 RepID=A0A6M3IQ59_9ZZZZ